MNAEILVENSDYFFRCRQHLNDEFALIRGVVVLRLMRVNLTFNAWPSRRRGTARLCGVRGIAREK